MSVDHPSDEAIDEAGRLADAEPEVVAHRVRYGELLRRAQRTAEAADALRAAARAYAVQEDWLEAFALARSLMVLDPDDRETQRFVTSSYSRRTPEAESTLGGRDPRETSGRMSMLEGPAPRALGTKQRFPLETSRLDELRGLPVLDDLGDGELQAIGHLLRTVVVQRGETIFREGERSVGMFVILRGEARVEVVNDAGGMTALTPLGRGEFFGEFSLFGPAVRSAMVDAAVRTELLDVDHELYEQLTERSARFRGAVARRFRSRLRENVVGRSSLFGALSAATRATIAEQLESQVVAAHELVVRRGDPTDRVCLLGQGRMEIYERDGDGAKARIAEMMAGQFLPDPAVLDGGPARFHARSLVAGVVYWMPRDLLLQHAASLGPAGAAALRRVFSETYLRSGAFRPVDSRALRAHDDPDRR